MIVHEIVKYKEVKPKFVSGSHEHRTEIFNRTLDNVFKSKFIIGGEYRVHGVKEKGVLIGIQEDIMFAEWDGLKVKIMEMWFSETNVLDIFHPSDLTKV